MRTLNKIVRMESFQDDFYRKPLEQMLELSDDAVRVLTQLKLQCSPMTALWRSWRLIFL